MNLANAYRNRIRGERAANIEAAIQAYQQALEIFKPEALPDECRKTARNLGNLYFGEQRWTEAGETYTLALEAAEILYGASVSLGGREAELAETGDLYRRAGYALAKTGQLQEATVALERGRARGLGDALARDRADLEAIKDSHPTLYTDYMNAAANMRQFESQVRGQSDGGTGPLSPEMLRDRGHSAKAALDEAIARIRQIEGYEDFLSLPGWDEVARAVEPGTPLVYIVTTPAGGAALAVHSDGVEVAWLDAMAEIRLRELLRDWLRAYSRRREDRQGWLDAIEQVTGALWDEVMGPVAAQFEVLGVEQAVLVPVGLLALLPLHAAWTKDGGQRVYALDRVTLTYAPSARALTHARRVAAQVGDGALLAIDEPKPVSANDLPSSKIEVEAIASLFAGSKVIRHKQATREDVLDAIPQAEVSHFSCHGANNWQNPLESGLLMAHNEMLTVQDLFNLELEGARLAVLSACETGIIGTDLPDEVVAMPMAFARAGFAGVVASLWSVADVSTAMLMERFYRLWREDGMSPASALREAQRWLRDTTNQQKIDYFGQDIPDYVPMAERMSAETAGNFFSAVLRKGGLDAKIFEHPYWWAAFYLTGV
jgi:CHAT domain-containing protein